MIKNLIKNQKLKIKLIRNKIGNRTTKVPKNSKQNNLETVPKKHVKEIPKERYVRKARNY